MSIPLVNLCTLGSTVSGPNAPRWAVVLVTVLALVVISVHILSLASADIAPSRRRIRIANGFLMMLGVASLAYAIGVSTPDRPREFTLAWTMVLAMMAMVIGVASIDALNTLRLHSLERRAIRRELDKARLEVAGLTMRREREVPPSSSHPHANTPA